MDLNVVVPGKKAAKKVSVPQEVFACDFNETLVHQVVVAHMAGARAGTKAQKTRSEVRGGGKKPWRQKGTGSARAGTIRSPIWQGGGVVFAAKPRDYSQKVNKKMYRVALRSIVSELIRQDRLMVVESLEIKSPKTKELNELLMSLGLNKVLLVSDNVDQNLYLAARNLPNVAVSDVIGLDPVRLVKHEKILVTVEALKQIGEKLQ